MVVGSRHSKGYNHRIIDCSGEWKCIIIFHVRSCPTSSMLSGFNSDTTPVIYMSGGKSDQLGCYQSVNDIAIFDIVTTRWCKGASMTQRRSNHGAVYFQNKSTSSVDLHIPTRRAKIALWLIPWYMIHFLLMSIKMHHHQANLWSTLMLLNQWKSLHHRYILYQLFGGDNEFRWNQTERWCDYDDT